MPSLPIDEIKDQVIISLKNKNRIIISSLTGSGKSTHLPQFLLNNLDIKGKILILQPRRLAAKMLASYVAKERNEKIGKEVGYQTKFESVISKETKLIYLTDGLLLKFFQQDPLIKNIDFVIFDEFHERSLASDLSLALVCRLQKIRPELKLIVMSATLDCDYLANYLGKDIPIITSVGKTFPVNIKYLSMPLQKTIWDKSAELAFDYITQNQYGNILIFMPGFYEINKTIIACKNLIKDSSIFILPLYGNMSEDDQKKVMLPLDKGQRKIIIATTIAETSLTIPGIKLVIDSGLVKVGRYNPLLGINSLLLEKNSQNSADQRAGRAGREAPGECIRLWTKEEHQTKNFSIEAEIERVDLSETLLFLAGINICSFNNFNWFQSPTQNRITFSQQYLTQIKALTENCTLTNLGKELLKFSLPPKLALFLIEAKKVGQFYPASFFIAIYLEQLGLNTIEKIMKTVHYQAEYPSEILDFMEYLYCPKMTVEYLTKKNIPFALASRIIKTMNQLQSQAKEIIKEESFNEKLFLKALLKSFPDHLISQRSSGFYELANGKQGEIPPHSLFQYPILIALDIKEIGDIQRKNLKFNLLSKIENSWLKEIFPDQYFITKEYIWDNENESILLRTRERCCGIISKDIIEIPESNQDVINFFIQKFKENKIQIPSWDEKVDQWITRVRFLANLIPEKKLITYDSTDMECIYYEIFNGVTKIKHLKNINCLNIVKNVLSWEDQQFVQQQAPDKIPLSGGHFLKLTYEINQPVKGSARITDLYDLKTLPQIAMGKTKILLNILAPNWRTVQITDDLPRFWKEHYPKLKKELSRRYPKHPWK